MLSTRPATGRQRAACRFPWHGTGGATGCTRRTLQGVTWCLLLLRRGGRDGELLHGVCWLSGDMVEGYPFWLKGHYSSTMQVELIPLQR